MKHLICVFWFLGLGVPYCSSQNKITKVVVDSSSKSPIPFANVVSINNRLQGTITNEDGVFIMRFIDKTDSFEVSHIGYDKTIFSSKFKNDTIYLKSSITLLDEVIINELSANNIINRMIENLEANHSVEPVTYSAFIRIVEYPQDTSVIHIFEEHLVNIQQTKENHSKFNVIKTRVKSFSDEGERRLRDMRLINMASVDTDNIFRYKSDFLKAKKTKQYRYTFIEETQVADSSFYMIKCSPKSDTSKISAKLFIDKQSFAIAKIIKYYENDVGSNNFTDINFKQYGDKWYLLNSWRHYYNSMYAKFYNGKGIHYTDRVCIYNLNNEANDLNKFKSFVNIVAEPVKRYKDNFTDEFWETADYLPIPSWIRKRLR